MGELLERLFRLTDNGTTVRTEIRAGAVTFLTMCYIIFVQPVVLGSVGMDKGALMVATCLASALACLVMAFVANYPVALAPCMGENFFFATVATMVIGGTAVGWRVALTTVFISGVLFLVLSFFKVRERIFEAIPSSLRHSIAAGIGVFIAFIGLREAGIVVGNPGSLVTLGDLSQGAPLLALFGLVLTAALLARRVKGAILIGLLVTAVVGLPFGLVVYPGGAPLSAPPSLAPIAFQLDFAGTFTTPMVPIIIVFFLMVLFDTIGTLTGVGEQTGLIKEGKMPRVGRALLADACGTTAGALLGCSTVSSYIESAAGVAEGGRTGLAPVFTALLFLLAIFFMPIVSMIGGGVVPAGGGAPIHPVIAPVMIIVGSMMCMSLAKVPWTDPTEAIPAFLVIIGMPLTYNIANGLALGFAAYPLLKLLAGKGREVNWLVYVLGAVFVGHLVLVVGFVQH
ncbi:MAG: NCS2 family permease [Deltaproteobacteria bacterium]|nr:NCS2 family permease [Deltaproteobacteria bacterium]